MWIRVEGGRKMAKTLSQVDWEQLGATVRDLDCVRSLA